MNEAFAADYFRMTGNQYRFSVKFLIDFIFRHNVRYMFWVRKYMESGSLFARCQLYRFSRKYGLEMSPQVKIGKGFNLGHPYNITIGDNVVIGNNVNIHKGATIGVENRGSRAGSPQLGNQVYVGINATIVGNITIGDDVMIAPGAYVNFDVPSHSVVLGNPGVIRRRENATEGYIRNCVD